MSLAIPGTPACNRYDFFSYCFSCLLLLVCLSGCATDSLPPESEMVVELMSQRLTLARDVAWAKWADGLPVRNRIEEMAILDRISAQAVAADLDERAVLRFARAQIEASRLEQETWMLKWKESSPPEGNPPNLDKLHFRLTRLSSHLIAEWAALEGIAIPPHAVKARLVEDGIDPRAAEIAAAGFKP